MSKYPPKPIDRPGSPRFKKSASETYDLRAEFKTLNRDATKGPPYIAEGLSDTEVVISATTHLDEYLKIAIVIRFRKKPEKAEMKAVFSGARAPLNTFSSKIALCSLLGIVVNDMRHDLDILRELRNDFAHAAVPPSFQDEDIAKMCAKLRSKIAIKAKFDVPAKQQFVEACLCLTFYWIVTITRAMEETRCLSKYAGEVSAAATAKLEAMDPMIMKLQPYR